MLTGETAKLFPLSLQKEPASIWHCWLPTALPLTRTEVQRLFFLFYQWIRRKLLENCFQYLQEIQKRIVTKIKKQSFIFGSFLLATHKTLLFFFFRLPLLVKIKHEGTLTSSHSTGELSSSLILYHWLCFLQEDLFWFLMLFILMKECVIIFLLL